MNRMKVKKPVWVGMIVAVAVSLLTSLFFYVGKTSGFIPYGTHEGGVRGAMGVAAIMLVCFMTIYVWYTLKKKRR